MKEAITILTTEHKPKDRLLLTKQIRADGTKIDYDNAYLFTLAQRKVGDIKELAKLLSSLQGKEHSAIIRDAPRDHVSLNHSWRRTKENFQDRPLHSVTFDIDHHVIPAGMDGAADLPAIFEDFVQTNMPRQFRAAAYYWTATSSHGLPSSGNVLRGRLAFWLETAYTSMQLRRWAEELEKISRCEFDKTGFAPVQLLYTAAPIFEDPKMNPMAGYNRRGFAEKPVLAVPLKIRQDILDRAEQLARQSLLSGRKLIDPRTKTGIIGAICRAYSIDDYLDTLAKGEFIRISNSTTRLDWSQGDRKGAQGAFITDDGMHITNTHDGDPLNGSAAHVYDLLLEHKYHNDPDALRRDFDSDPLVNAAKIAASVKEFSEGEEILPLAPEPKPKAAADLDSLISQDDFLDRPLPPGLLKDMTDYGNEISRHDEPIIGLVAALAALSALIQNRAIVRSRQGETALNLFFLATGKTGVGKETVITATQNLLSAAGLGSLASSDIASGPALRGALTGDRTKLLLMDEIGRMFKSAEQQTGGVMYDLITMIMRLFSGSMGYLPEKEYSDRRKNLPTVYRPYVAMLGLSTMEALAPVVTEHSLAMGVFNRFMLIPLRKGDRRLAGSTKVPDTLKNKLIQLNAALDFDPTDTKTGQETFNEVPSYVYVLSIDAARLLDSFIIRADKELDQSEEQAQIWVRAIENVLKLSTLISVTEGLGKPDRKITKAHMEWAISFVDWSISKMERLVHGAAGQTETRTLQDGILKFISDGISGKAKQIRARKNELNWNSQGWITHSQLVYRFRNNERRKLDEALAILVSAEMLTCRAVANKTDKKSMVMLYKL